MSWGITRGSASRNANIRPRGCDDPRPPAALRRIHPAIDLIAQFHGLAAHVIFRDRNGPREHWMVYSPGGRKRPAVSPVNVPLEKEIRANRLDWAG